MMELIGKWNTSAASLEAAATMTEELCRSRYGNHYKRLDREQQREFRRLSHEAENLRNQAGVYKRCADDLTARFTTNA